MLFWEQDRRLKLDTTANPVAIAGKKLFACTTRVYAVMIYESTRTDVLLSV
jgi:hypothetical protein